MVHFTDIQISSAGYDPDNWGDVRVKSATAVEGNGIAREATMCELEALTDDADFMYNAIIRSIY